MKLIQRRQEDDLRRLLRNFPAVLVTGPRQCGKSTLVRMCLKEWTFLDLERPADIALLRADLEGFFDVHSGNVVFDEAQQLPELFPLLRTVLDRSRRKGRFVLTGSASPALIRSVSETLAGRIGLLELTPFRSMELRPKKQAEDRWFWGGYPPVHALQSATARVDWLDAYVSTFLERDLPNLGLRLPPARLRTLWMMLTHVHGNLLNISDLARSLSVSAPTVGHYLDVLEGAFMIRRLPPHFANVQKRLTKAPKIFIRDTGLLHFLAGLRHPGDLKTWPRLGSSFEGMVIEEVIAQVRERVVRPHIAFWRTRAGGEVDLILGDGKKLVPIEIRRRASIGSRELLGLRNCMTDLGLKRGYVIADVPEPRRIGHSIEIVPWREVAAGRVTFGLGRARREAGS